MPDVTATDVAISASPSSPTASTMSVADGRRRRHLQDAQLGSSIEVLSIVTLSSPAASAAVQVGLSAVTAAQAEVALSHPILAVQPATVITLLVSTAPPSTPSPPVKPPPPAENEEAPSPPPPADDGALGSLGTTTTQALASSGDGGISGAGIAGVVVGCLALVAAIAVGCVVYRRRKAKKPLAASVEVQPTAVEAVSSTASITPRGAAPTPRAVAPPPREAEAQAEAVVPPREVAVVIESADPVADHKEVKARLREYEIAFEQREGRKPRKRAEWGDMWPEYERYAALRKLASSSKLLVPPEPEPVPELPAAEPPAAKASAVEASAAEAPDVEAPALKTPPAEARPAEAPAVEAPAAEPPEAAAAGVGKI